MAAGKEISRKITVATITGGPKKWFERLFASPEKQIPLMAVYGVATNTSHGASDFGEWTKIHGSFRAVNLETGEITNSSIVMLPPFLTGALEGAIKGLNAQSVEFAFEIHAKVDASSAQKFQYVVFDKMPPSAADPMEALELRLGIRKQEALAAPETPAPTSAPAPAPAPTGKKGK